MSAPELLAVIRQLSGLAEGLAVHLAEVCGPCTDCGEDCPGDDLDALEKEEVGLSERLRKELGIPEGAKLCVEVDREAGALTVSASSHRYDLRDVPEDLLDVLIEAGACLGALEKHMILEDVIYGR